MKEEDTIYEYPQKPSKNEEDTLSTKSWKMNGRNTCSTPEWQTGEDNVEEEMRPKKGVNWRRAGMFGAGGLAFGGAYGFWAGDEENELSDNDRDRTGEIIDEPTTAPDGLVGQDNVSGPSGQQQTAPLQESNVNVARVDDDMSFGQAFAAARRQTGPGGVFEWRGNRYSTYYENEWENLSPAERTRYDQESIEALQDVGNAHSETAQVLGQEQIMTEDGSLMTTSLVDYGQGHTTILVDVDNNNIADVRLDDLNHNQSIETNEVTDVTGQNISMTRPSRESMVQTAPDETGTIQTEPVHETEQVDSPEYETEAYSAMYDAENDVTYVAGSLEGRNAIFVDVGGGEVEGVLLDTNNDGKLTKDELFSLEGSGITLDSLIDDLPPVDDSMLL